MHGHVLGVEAGAVVLDGEGQQAAAAAIDPNGQFGPYGGALEAGIVDGLSYSQVFRRIALPLSAPALITITVLQFIQIWDDLLVGLLFLQNPQQRTITVGLGALAAEIGRAHV